MKWKNIEQRREYNRKWRKAHREKLKKYKEKHKEYQREYYKKWREKNKEYQNRYQKRRKQTEPRFRLDSNIRSMVSTCLKGKKNWQKWQNLVGYTLENLTKHLESHFDDKMNWNNYGSYWEIDHRKPKSLFKYETAEDLEFKKCWALSNLQPLEKYENRKKFNKF